MRKYIKDDLLKIIEQLHNVNETLLQKGKMISQEQAQSILTDCQQGAVEVGNKIEAQVGEGTEAVRQLEVYCEKMYLLCVNWQDASFKDKELKNVRLILNKVKNGILYDIPDSPKEVVFLPYKASMWDSLESVWLKAVEDEGCNVSVIPIPYYDKNPDGSLGQMHYEGDLYPDNVSIVHYESYDFEKKHPDVIFIHNPYDEANHVTSVHPAFYSKQLKQYTDMLVYIPYFVLGEPILDNEESIESMAHFCTTPGVLYADRVIVQSENMRKAYIQVLSKLLGKDANTKAYLEKKILGLGSPKYDKIKRSKKEEQEIPTAWKDLICKPDGGWKKIILYNTTIDGMLRNNDEMIAKIKQALTVFYENRDDVVLLWRPHPLLKTTLQSMRPRLLDEYNRIVEKYIEEGWGIYDDTPDMNRAIVISDAYYGDWSSLVQLYQCTGKPIMIQNVKV